MIPEILFKLFGNTSEAFPKIVHQPIRWDWVELAVPVAPAQIPLIIDQEGRFLNFIIYNPSGVAGNVCSIYAQTGYRSPDQTGGSAPFNIPVTGLAFPMVAAINGYVEHKSLDLTGNVILFLLTMQNTASPIYVGWKWSP